jgi:hypothetical protein
MAGMKAVQELLNRRKLSISVENWLTYQLP